MIIHPEHIKQQRKALEPTHILFQVGTQMYITPEMRLDMEKGQHSEWNRIIQDILLQKQNPNKG